MGHVVLISDSIPELLNFFTQGLNLTLHKSTPGYCELRCASGRTLALVSPETLRDYIPVYPGIPSSPSSSIPPVIISWQCASLDETWHHLQQTCPEAFAALQPVTCMPWGKRMALIELNPAGPWLELTE
jgi:hypothetical protein